MKQVFPKEKERMDKELYKLCRQSKVAGANVAFFNDKEILYGYNYGYINKEANLKSSNESLYMIGSNTKVMTALGIFKLVEENKISLEDDVKKYIPEFEVQSLFAYNSITIEHLLMHRSGLVSDLYNIILDSTKDYRDVVDTLKDTYLTSLPGQMFSYSNVGYTVLGIVIERVSGMPYTEYIQKVIGEPLGIQIHFLTQAQEKESFCSTISLSYNKKGKVMTDMTTTMLPAGSNTYMSIDDFVRFGQIFLNKDNTILKRETLEWMEQLNVKESIDKELCNIGYGLIHNNYDFGETVGKVLGHGGDTTCHHSVFNYIPSLNIGVVVFTNSEHAVSLSRVLGLKVLTKYLEEKGYVYGKRSLEHKHVEVSCEEYIGRYATVMGLFDMKKNRKGELTTKISKLSVKLVPCEDGYLQCYPNTWLYHLPPYTKTIKGLRIKVVPYSEADVLVLEQTRDSYRSKMIIGCRYQGADIPKSFQDACGEYEVTNLDISRNKKDDYYIKCSLTMEHDMLKLRAEERDTIIILYPKAIDDSLAITQGFGRNAREMIQLSKDGKDTYIKYAGVVLKKIQD